MEKKKKILYVITKSNLGGAQKYVFDLATSLPKDTYEVVVAFGGEGVLKKKLREADIRTISLSSLERDVSLFKDWKVFKELLSLCKTEKPDVIHLNSSKIGLLGSLAGRLKGIKKIIFTAHGWAFNETARSFFSRFIILKLSAWTAILSTDIIVLSQKEKKQTRWFLVVPQKKIHLIRNGIRPFPYLTKEEALEKLQLSPNKTYIGTVAELHKNKGLDILLRTMPHLDAELILIGGGEEEGLLKELARDLQVSEKVHFLGSITGASTYLKAFDIFVLPSRKEGLPFAILEAGFAGLPVVASEVGGIPEIIIDENTGVLTKPNNTESLKDGLEKMLHNEAFRNSVQKNLHHHIENNFSFQKSIRETQNLY